MESWIANIPTPFDLDAGIVAVHASCGHRWPHLGGLRLSRIRIRAGHDGVVPRARNTRGVTLAMETHTRLCKLQYELGRVERCPESACPFWEPGGAVLDGRCAVERLDLAGRPEVADWLIRIRKRLETAKSEDDEEEVRRLFYRLLNTDDADGG